MKLKLIILFCICSFIACNKNRTPNFYKIHSEGPEIYINKQTETYSKTEIFVVSDPPIDTITLLTAIENYNFKTLSLDSLKKYNNYNRIFYKETELLTRNFEYDKPYPNTKAKDYDALIHKYQDLSHHGEDKLITISYSKYYDRRIIYIYIYGNSRYWHEQNVTDLDSFYNVKKKEYGIK